jgi:putative glutamine amidotransferase
MKNKVPVIGITLDYEIEATYSKYPWYALRENYCTSVADFGAIPLPLPHFPAFADDYLAQIDGLIITGGNFDVSPELYGQTVSSDKVTTKNTRTQFEYAILQGALERNIPVLGICGGQQLINVVLGGTLIQHIPDSYPDSNIAHEQPNPRNEVSHQVNIIRDSLLHKIVGASEIMVNSAHHQAVDKVADGAIANAYAEDGVNEGIESKLHRFCLGVQWHPEFLITQADRNIYQAFIAHANINSR